MNAAMNRRDFLKLAGAAGGVFLVSGLAGCSKNAAPQSDSQEGFYFVQLSDTHWGFEGPAINPDAAGTLKKAIAGVNALPQTPDFVVFTGDLTQTVDDSQERRRRMKEFRQIVAELKVQDVRFLPGEHDAALDNGEAYQEILGKTHYTFDHKGVHFIVLDNVSDPHAALGDPQLQWLSDDLKGRGKEDRIVVLTHRPLFDLAADWDWATVDGAKAVDMLMPFAHVTVLYGHIHQTHDHMTSHIDHHSAASLIWPLPAPHSAPKKGPVPWDASHPYKGLGYRQVQARVSPVGYALTELPVAPLAAAATTASAADAAQEQVVKITAKKFEYSPREITLKKGVPVTVELTSLDRTHGFNCPGLNVRSDIPPGQTTRVRFVPDKAGRFDFHCDLFCGSGHEQMTGTFIVTE